MQSADIAGVVLAGGRSQRMGGREKALIGLAGEPMLGHILQRFAPQVGALAINANGDPARFTSFSLAVIPDRVPDFPGPASRHSRWTALGSCKPVWGNTHCNRLE